MTKSESGKINSRRERFVNLSMGNEISRKSGLYYSDHPYDMGGATVFGISKVFHRKAFETAYAFYKVYKRTKLDSVLTAGIDYSKWYIGETFYDEDMKFINNERTAFRIFDFGVNAGKKHSVLTAQRLLIEQYGFTIIDDGILGSRTVSALNTVNPGTFLTDLIKKQSEYYKTRSTASVFLKSWLNRFKSHLEEKI